MESYRNKDGRESEFVRLEAREQIEGKATTRLWPETLIEAYTHTLNSQSIAFILVYKQHTTQHHTEQLYKLSGVSVSMSTFQN